MSAAPPPVPSAPTVPTPNLDAARAFLVRLDPEADTFTLQTFDDTQKKRAQVAAIHHCALDETAGAKLANWNRHGVGVFVTVNETDGTGRQTHNVRRVRALFVDLDGAPLGPILSAPLSPHIVVESSPGRYHAYWLCDDCPLAQFNAAQRALAARFGGDPSVHDLPRVMRLPGFVHRKGAPFLTHELPETGTNLPPYSFAEIVGALALDLTGASAARPTPPSGATGKVGAGGRHAHLFAHGRSMAKKRLTPEAVRAALDAENAARCDPPLPKRDVDDLATRAFTAKDATTWEAANRPVERATAPDVAGEVPAMPGAPAGDPGGGEWPEPQPLIVAEDATPYPLDALPAGVREAVAEVLDFVQCPPALAACSALAALSLAGQPLADVRRAERLQGPTSLYLLAVGESGERKSTCDGYFLAPIRDWEHEQAERTRPDVARSAAALAAWEERKAGIKARIRDTSKKGDGCGAMERELADVEADAPQPFRLPRLIHADATPEALAWSLARGWPSGGVMSSEAGIVFGGHGMGRDSVMRNLSLLNALWDGATHRVERRTSDSFTLAGVRLTMGLAAQPETVRQFMEGTKGLARGNGFAARFLIAAPQSTQGRRRFREAGTWRYLPAFAVRLGELLDMQATPDESGALSPPVLALSAEARAAWQGFYNDVEDELRPGGEMHEVRDVASKAADNVARMAALFHLYAHGLAGEVQAEAVEAAARIVGWHLYQARAFLGEVAAPRALSTARRLDAWLIDRCARDCVAELPRRLIQNEGPNPVRNRAMLDSVLAELVEAGRVREADDGRRKLVRINPALLGGGNGAP